MFPKHISQIEFRLVFGVYLSQPKGDSIQINIFHGTAIIRILPWKSDHKNILFHHTRYA